MNGCLVSIVTITKNHKRGLAQTLTSVKEQAYPNIEHLVIDGDSTDGSQELLQSFVHSKQYVFYSEPDRGIADAFNKGLAKISGDLIFFLNSGDTFFSNSVISEVVASYQKNRWKCAQGGVIVPSHSTREVLYMPPKLPSHFLHYFMFLPHQGFFCEASLHKRYRFDESIKTSMDYDLFLRMLQGLNIFYLPLVITQCEPGGGIAGNWQLRVSEQSQIRQKYANTMIDRTITTCVSSLIYWKNSLKIGSPFSKRWEPKSAD
jgi:glycosyltransferase involved in cell wall biosynthesis